MLDVPCVSKPIVATGAHVLAFEVDSNWMESLGATAAEKRFRADLVTGCDTHFIYMPMLIYQIQMVCEDNA